MSVVQTIRGPVESAELGRTLSHEHMAPGSAGMERIPGLYDEAEALKSDIEALGRARGARIDSIIDLTPFDLGRQISLFESIAEADTGVNIVCATGVYRWVPFYFMLADADAFAEYFLSEIRDGIEGTSIKAGIIKLAWDLEYRLDEGPVGPRQLLEKSARGAARAAKASGVPISCHTRAVDELGTPLLDIFEDEGLDLRAVTIGHTNDSTDIDYVTGLAKRGATVGLDRFSSDEPDYVAQRSGIALEMVKAGFAEQTSLGHDGFPYVCIGIERPPNPDCWLKVPNVEVPWLLENGATEADVDLMLRGSIRTTFEAAAAMAAP
jgi:phosphotriesterase-related protein